LTRYVKNGSVISIDPSGLHDGHHIFPKEFWKYFEFDDIVHNFLDKNERAKIFFEGYTSHSGTKVNGIRHYDYSRAIEAELLQWFGGLSTARPIRLDLKEANDLIDAINRSDNATIKGFNWGVQKEAQEAQRVFQKIKEASLAEMDEAAASAKARSAARDAAKAMRQVLNESAEEAGRPILRMTAKIAGKYLPKAIRLIGPLAFLGYYSSFNRGLAGEGRYENGGPVGALLEAGAEAMFADEVNKGVRMIVEPVGDALELRSKFESNRVTRELEKTNTMNPHLQHRSGGSR
jgi:hypothetical protein